MPYDGKVAELPGGRAGMVNHQNRLLSRPEELFDANGIAYEQRLIRKEPGATDFDTAGINNSPTVVANLSGTAIWALVGVSLEGDGITPPAFVQSLGAVAGLVGPGPLFEIDFITTVNHTAGHVIIVGVSGALNKTEGSPIVRDSVGNSYSRIPVGSIGPPCTALFFSDGAIALPSGGFIQLVVPASSFGKWSLCAAEFANVLTVDRFAANQHADMQAHVALPSLSMLPEMVVGGGGCFNTGGITVTGAGSPPFTLANQATSGTASDDIHGWLEYRLDTAATPTIVALFDWWSLKTPAAAGSVATTQGSTTVVGTGTTFSNFRQNDRIILHSSTNPERRIITAIADNTHLTIDDPSVQTAAGGAFIIVTGPRLISASLDGTLNKEENGNLDAVALKSGLSTSARPGFFVAGGKESGALPRKLFYFNGVNKPQVLADDANSTTDLSTPPADWTSAHQPVGAVVHNNALVAYGALTDPHRLYFSSPTNHEDFTTVGAATTVRTFAHIGDRVFAAAPYQGVLHVFKYPCGIFYVDDSDLDITQLKIRLKSSGLGIAASPYAALNIDDDILFLTPNCSFHMLSAVDTLGGTRASDLSYALGLRSFLHANVNLSKLNQAVSVWYPDRKLALWGLPGTGSMTNTLMLKFDFSDVSYGGPVKFAYSFRDGVDALALKRDLNDYTPMPILGEGGHVWLLDQEARAKGGAPYTGSYRTPALDFSHLDPKYASIRKQYDFLETVFNPVSAGSVDVTVYVDGVARQSLNFDATKRRVRHKLSVGDGYTIEVAGTNSTVNEDFQILSHLVYFTPLREDTSRTQGGT